MALIREMFGLSVTLVTQGCMLPYEEDPVSPLSATNTGKLQAIALVQQQETWWTLLCAGCACHLLLQYACPCEWLC